ncbi:MAG: GntR family transcriptional regulator [Actinomycetota bacterium]|nr:GntR family transcriptional regulator [Actinomycetota bacterium]
MKIIEPLGADDIPTAHRAVRQRIRRAIVSGELPGGSRLVQSELARSLAVSVTPVREALRDLVGEGIVDFDAFRGATVHQTSLSELDEVYQLRRLLTPLAVRSAVEKITEDELRRAETIEQMMESSEGAEWIELNGRFHSVLDGAAQMPRLQEILSRLADISALYVGVAIGGNATRRLRGDRDHEEMIAAYRARDVERSVEVALAHLEDTLEVARASMERGEI